MKKLGETVWEKTMRLVTQDRGSTGRKDFFKEIPLYLGNLQLESQIFPLIRRESRVIIANKFLKSFLWENFGEENIYLNLIPEVVDDIIERKRRKNIASGDIATKRLQYDIGKAIEKNSSQKIPEMVQQIQHEMWEEIVQRFQQQLRFFIEKDWFDEVAQRFLYSIGGINSFV